MTGCCIRGCTNNSSKGVYMTCLPTNPARRELWIANIKQFGNTNLFKKRYCICQVRIIYYFIVLCVQCLLIIITFLSYAGTFC